MIETINWLALTVPFIATSATYSHLREKALSQVWAGMVALLLFASILVGYTVSYKATGFPMWMRWLSGTVRAEPLPGRPDMDINTKLDANWTVVGMNYEWMVLVAKTHLQIGKRPEVYVRWEYTKPQVDDSGKTYHSAVEWTELDCNERKSNILVLTYFANNNLSGGEVYTEHGDSNNPLWDTPKLGSIGAEVIKKSCELF